MESRARGLGSRRDPQPRGASSASISPWSNQIDARARTVRDPAGAQRCAAGRAFVERSRRVSTAGNAVGCNRRGALPVLLQAQYDAWGNVTSYSVQGIEQGTDLSAWPLPHGFAGGLLDVDTGLLRFGARDYDPSVGRWTAKDPILFEGGQANLWVYVGNDPVNDIDPRGEFGLVGAGVGAGIGGVVSGVLAYRSGARGADLAASVAGGFVSGGIAGAFPGSFLTEFIVNTGATAAGLGVEAAVNGKDIDPFAFGLKSLAGGLLGAGASKFSGGVLPGGDVATAFEAGAIGLVFGGPVSEATDALCQ